MTHEADTRDIQAEADAYRELKKRADKLGFPTVNNLIDEFERSRETEEG